MSAERLEMRTIREILRLRHECGLSHREVARSVGRSASTVADCLGRAKASGLTWPRPEEMDEGVLEARLYPPVPGGPLVRSAPDWGWVHRELRRKGVALQLLWEEYKAAHPDDGYQYSQFRDLDRRFARQLDVVMRQVHRAGEKVFVELRDHRFGSVGEERFGMIVDREWTERQDRRLKNRLKGARLRQPACLEDVNYRHSWGLDRSVLQRLATCRWVKDHESVIITGATGLGKTWLACALAHQACREGYTALYIRVPRLLQAFGVSRADGSYVRELARLAKTDVLILDDWGLAPMTETGRHDILEVLEDCHGVRSTIVTSQIPVSKWHDTIADPTLADAILDRLVHGAHRIELAPGPSMRQAHRVGEHDE